MLTVGMPLQDVVRAVTATPAAAIGCLERLGTLGVGREADITILELRDVDVMLEDCQSQRRRCRQRLVAHAVWRAGERAEVTEPPHWPNQRTIDANRPAWDMLLVRDALAPAPCPEGTASFYGAHAARCSGSVSPSLGACMGVRGSLASNALTASAPR